MFEIQSKETWQGMEGLFPSLEHMKITKGTGPSIRRSKRPLLTCCIRCKRFHLIFSEFGKKFKLGNKY